MTIRSRTWIIVTAVSAVLALALVITARIVILEAFSKVERTLALQNLRRAVNTLQSVNNKLNTSTGDYSSWDNTYKFIHDSNPAYKEENFLAESFFNLDIQCMLFFDTTGTLRCQACFSGPDSEQADAPTDLITAVRALPGLFSLPDTSHGVAGIAFADNRPLMVASRPILRNDYKGPSRGELIFIRILDSAAIAQMSATMDMALSVSPLESPLTPQHAREMQLTGGMLSIHTAGPDSLHGHAVLNDIGGKPALMLNCTFPRVIYAAGVRSFSYAIIWLLSIVSIFAVLILLVFDTGVLSRIAWARQAIDAIKRSPEPQRRIEIIGQDEFSTLAGDINGMLEALEQVQARADKSEEQYRLLFNQMLNAFALHELVYNSEGRAVDYRFLEINPAFERLTGLRRETTIGKTVCEMLPVVEPEWIERYARVVATGEAVHFEGRSESIGKYFEVMAFKAGEKRFGVTSTDISTRKKAEEQRKEAQEQLIQFQKMEAIGQLAGGFAHDLNNQLGGVLGYADLVREQVSSDPRMARFMNNMILGISRATDLTTQLLAFARKGKFLAAPVNMHSVVQEVIHLLEHSLDKRILIRQHLNAGVPVTIGDPTQLQNVVLNLALNARDAMPEGGSLTFASEITQLDKTFCTRHQNELLPGTYLCLSVSDTGTGMDKETLRRAFEPFFTTKPVGKGTGMGLAAAYGTIKNHHGAITLNSEPGRGTTASVYLLSAPPTGETAPEEDSEVTKIPGEPHILVVDDDPLFAQMAVDLLTGMGCQVSLRTNGKDAIDFYSREWNTIDFVLLDLVMPELGGRDTFLRMQKINPHIMAVLSSGYSLDGEAQEMIDKGVVAFVKKPYHGRELGNVLLRLIEQLEK